MVAWPTRRRLAVRRPVGTDWYWLVAGATAGLTLYNLALVEAVRHAEAPLVASVVSGVPLVLAIAAPLAARRPIGVRLVAGAGAVVVGSAVTLGAGRSNAAGVVLAVLALGCECAFTLLGVPVLERLGPISIATHTAWIAAVQLSALAVVRRDLDALIAWDRAAVLAIGYLIAASALAFVLWFDAIGDVGSERAGLAAGVIPIAALATGVPLGIASLNTAAILGTVIVVAGVAIGLRSRRDHTAMVIA
jgi:drug/metabolite transporter (DMT)-like permease